MKKNSLLVIVLMIFTLGSYAQVEPGAGKWKTWFISSGKDYRLPAPTAAKDEIAQVIAAQKNLDSAGKHHIIYWNAGSPGYRWQEMITKLWTVDTNYTGVLANMLLGTATYDAIIAAWDTKYAYKKLRPFASDNKIALKIPDPRSPSYPCEHSVAAGVAVAVFSKYYPKMADSVNKLAQQCMASRIAAGVAFPSDTRAGFELGKKIAEIEIEKTLKYTPQMTWDRNMPQQAGLWKGPKPMFPLAAHYKTIVMESASQYRPGPPPDFAKEMDELKKFKPTFRSIANAFNFAAQPVWDDLITKKLFEYRVHDNVPRMARLGAATNVAMYDGFIACFDAKYAYWGIRPNQYDTTFVPVLIHTPPFPGYPSGHAMIGSVLAELYSYFFPADKEFFAKKAKDGAESRFHGGIHFRSDNEVGLELGKKIGAAIIARIKNDGSE